MFHGLQMCRADALSLAIVAVHKCLGAGLGPVWVSQVRIPLVRAGRRRATAGLRRLQSGAGIDPPVSNTVRNGFHPLYWLPKEGKEHRRRDVSLLE